MSGVIDIGRPLYHLSKFGLDDYSLVFLSGCKGTTFLNPPNFRGINLLKIFKVDNKSPFTECGLC